MGLSSSGAIMRTAMKLSLRVLSCALLLLCVSSPAQAQRVLTWESINVAARLEHDGALLIAEEQAMVFTGDWNGGERRFNIRPRQRLEFIDIARLTDAGWQVLSEDSDLDSVDDFAFTERYTLRWRSRMPEDPPFSHQVIRYRLRYRLSNILVKDGSDFTLDHDFLFPERNGAIDRFALKLELDPVWSPKTGAPDTYSAANLAPGRGFVVTIPLRYTGDLAPGIRDTSRPPEIVQATWLLLAFSGIALAWFFLRERSLGRFEPLPAGIDEGWLREHILAHPAEVVGATWDDGIGSAEVVSLIARMESEEKLRSDLKDKEMKLHLLVDRDKLEGYERTLVDKLFFDHRSTTSPAAIRSHYQKQGLQPAEEISKELGARVDALLGQRGKTKIVGLIVFVLVLAGLAMGFLDWRQGNGSSWGTPVLGVVALIVLAIAWNRGALFRMNIHWGMKRFWWMLTPALVVLTATTAFLWYWVGPGEVETTPMLSRALAVLAAAIVLATVAGGRSRRSREALAFRKKLAAGREFLISELEKPEPALRDEWMPWLLAFGLSKHVDDWSAQRAPEQVSSGGSRVVTSSGWSGSSSSPSSSGSSWGGFSGGRSGGGGATGSWAAAAGGFASNVAPASSSSSGGGGGGGGGSSSGGSSGGGGGGGW